MTPFIRKLNSTQPFHNLIIAALFSTSLVFITGCASLNKEAEYLSAQNIEFKTSTTIRADVTTTWKRAVIQLTRNNFFIENSDQYAGLINISFTQTPPDKFVTCGSLTVNDKRLSGTRKLSYDPAASASFGKGYKNNGEKVKVTRSTLLTGKANILFLERPNNRTRVLVNALYTLSSKTQYKTGDNITDAVNQNYSFSTVNRFEGEDDANNVKIVCQSKGALEKILLNIAKSADLEEDDEEDEDTY